MLSNKINFFCPNCSSDKYIGKTTIGKNYKDEPYKHVTSEIQCAKCFMDIPSIISENISLLISKMKCPNFGMKYINHHIKKMPHNVQNVLGIIGK